MIFLLDNGNGNCAASDMLRDFQIGSVDDSVQRLQQLGIECIQAGELVIAVLQDVFIDAHPPPPSRVNPGCCLTPKLSARGPL